MYVLYCDETNLQKRAGDFLIYGGLGGRGPNLLALSRRVDAIRNEFGLDPEFKLKFNPGPVGMEHERFIELKQTLLEEAGQHQVGLLAYAIMHDIAESPDVARRNGINVVSYHFDCLLKRNDECGLILLDRFNDEGNAINAHLTKKFSIGLTGMPYSAEMRLSNIMGFHYSAVGQSHIPSLVDIALGSLRFAMNAYTHNDHQHHETAHTLLRLLHPMLDKEESGDISELAFTFSPKIVKAPKYRAVYQGMKDFFAAGGWSLKQEITDQRTY